MKRITADVNHQLVSRHAFVRYRACEQGAPAAAGLDVRGFARSALRPSPKISNRRSTAPATNNISAQFNALRAQRSADRDGSCFLPGQVLDRHFFVCRFGLGLTERLCQVIATPVAAPALRCAQHRAVADTGVDNAR